MPNFFPNFLLLDYSEELGFTSFFNKPFNSHLIKDLEIFLKALLNQQSAPSQDKVLIALPENPFCSQVQKLPSLQIDSINFLTYSKQQINDHLKEQGVKEGTYKIINEIFLKCQGRLSLIIGSEIGKTNFLNHYFHRQIAHDLDSQPIWLLPKKSLQTLARDDLYLELSLLADNYYFLNDFWFIIYDDENKIELKHYHRSLLENKDNWYALLTRWEESQNSSNQITKQVQVLLHNTLPSELVKVKVSPIHFKKQLIDQAKQAQKKILLVEGNEPRVLKAVEKCIKVGITQLAILGNPKEIYSLVEKHHIDIASHLTSSTTDKTEGSDKIEIIEPRMHQEKYVPTLYEIMKRKNITMEEARQMVKEDLYLAALLLREGLVGGVVAGAHYSTADTLKAAIRVVGMAPGYSLISSFFIMLLPQDVMIFGDCAVNPSPDSEQLADITLQSIQSAHRFFEFPIHTSLISFSTMGSAKTPEVEKVAEAVKIAQDKAKALGLDNIIIEGPVQYDAATNSTISMKKFPESKIVGRSNVLIFPNLDTGNTVYKAVQQNLAHFNCHSIGPIIQGLKKPFNDLSRGSTVDDIFQTILITLIQSS